MKTIFLMGLCFLLSTSSFAKGNNSGRVIASNDCAAKAAEAISNNAFYVQSFCNGGNPLAAADVKRSVHNSNLWYWVGQCEGDSHDVYNAVTTDACKNFTVN